jgi:hypothetical protein
MCGKFLPRNSLPTHPCAMGCSAPATCLHRGTCRAGRATAKNLLHLHSTTNTQPWWVGRQNLPGTTYLPTSRLTCMYLAHPKLPGPPASLGHWPPAPNRREGTHQAPTHAITTSITTYSQPTREVTSRHHPTLQGLPTPPRSGVQMGFTAGCRHQPPVLYIHHQESLNSAQVNVGRGRQVAGEAFDTL